MTKAYPIVDHSYDCLVVGAGGSGLRAAVVDADPDPVADLPEVDVIVAPVGGGGFIAGLALAAKSLRPSVRIIGVEAARLPACLATLHGAVDRIVVQDTGSTDGTMIEIDEFELPADTQVLFEPFSAVPLPTEQESLGSVKSMFR